MPRLPPCRSREGRTCCRAYPGSHRQGGSDSPQACSSEGRVGSRKATIMAYRTGLFGGNSTGTRASLSYGHRKKDWRVALVRGSDSRGLSPASTALADESTPYGDISTVTDKSALPRLRFLPPAHGAPPPTSTPFRTRTASFPCDIASPCRELSPLSLSQFWGALHLGGPLIPRFFRSGGRFHTGGEEQDGCIIMRQFLRIRMSMCSTSTM